MRDGQRLAILESDRPFGMGRGRGTPLDTRPVEPGSTMDTVTPAKRSLIMARVKSRDTKPEMAVRRLVYSMGYRYRLQARDLPGTPDLVFRRMTKAIFVHGCFWHRHPSPHCKLSRLPKSRLEFWLPKLEANRKRDVRDVHRLKEAGWRVLTIWECELGRQEKLERKIKKFLDLGRHGDSGHA